MKTKPDSVEEINHSEFTRLYDPIHENLTRFCRALSGNTEDAKDLMHDVVLHTLENFNKIKDKSAFKSYVFSVASNLNKKRFGRKKFKGELNEGEFNYLIDTSQNQEYSTDFKIIYELILSLPTKMSETIILFHISDLPLEEIQKIQGGSLSGVKQRLKRGREKLIAQLKTPKQVKAAILFLSL
ncbi:RNA polymerase sigma factor [bacterium]|nr:RNA polymerase sigma factor [bacterium]